MIDDPKKNEPPAKDQGPAGTRKDDPKARGQSKSRNRTPGAGAGAGLPEEKTQEAGSPGQTTPTDSSKQDPTKSDAAKAGAGPGQKEPEKPAASQPPGTGTAPRAGSAETSQPAAARGPGRAEPVAATDATPATAATATATNARPAATTGGPVTAPGVTKPDESERTTASGGPGGGPPRTNGPAEPPTSPPPRRGHGCLMSALWAALAVVCVIAIGFLTWPYWSPYVEAYLPPPPGDQEASRQVAALEQRVAQLEQTLKERPSEQDTVKALRQEGQALREQMSTLGKRLQKIEEAAPQASSATSVSHGEMQQLRQLVSDLQSQLAQAQSDLSDVPQLRRQIDDLEQKTARAASPGAAAAALALNRLSEAASTSQPYANELDAFRAAAGEELLEDESLQPLEAHAESGVPTQGDLYQRFAATADAIERARSEMGGNGPWDKTVNRLRSLVTIRKTGEAALAEGGVDAILEQAKSRLQAGDLAGAVDALEGLEGPAAEAASPWIKDARARLDVNRAISRLQIQTITTLSSKEG